jgi:hypothetical protein
MTILAASLGVVSIYEAVHQDSMRALQMGAATAIIAFTVEQVFGETASVGYLAIHTLTVLVEARSSFRIQDAFRRSIAGIIFEPALVTP